MKLGLVGYQGSGKSTLFELLTAVKPDPAKAHLGQLGTAVVPDSRFDRLVALFKPKKTSPARIELFDTLGLDRKAQDVNAQRLGVIRESNAMVLVVGCFAGADPVADIGSFQDDIILADLQVVTNRMSRLQKDVAKPRPDREQLQAESAALEPIAARLNEGRSVADMVFTEAQDKATKSFSLLTRKKQLVILNTADSAQAAEVIGPLEAAGHRVVSAPIGLELEVQQLPPEDRETFAHEMGLGEPCANKVLRAIFEVTEQITFYTSDEKEVHAWLLHRGGTSLDAAGTIHTDLARGFIRAEITAVEDLLRLGSEREVKAAGLHRVEGKEYVMRDGDEIVVRFSV
jgi:ribosome-binding ATPase YchF (GTP1/OBG family)